MLNSDIYNKPKSLYAVGGILIGVGLIFTIVVFIKNISMYLLFLPAAFILIGILFIVIGVVRGKIINEYNNLVNDKSAYTTMATFVCSKFSSYQSKSVRTGNLEIPISANVYRKIIYSYIDENGVQRKGKSQLSYFKNQVDYLQNKGQFAIKCKGPLSAIIEPVPENTKNYNF